MKRIVFAACMLIALQSMAQDSTKQAAKPAPAPITYKNYKYLPAYKLRALDSTEILSTVVLHKKHESLIIYFSPTCSHCQHQAEEITSHIKDLQDVNILMVSSYPLSEIRTFAETYAINKFPNITLAYDPTYSLGHFFEISSLPGIYIYDKKGEFKKNFATNQKIETLLAALKD